jgi:myo-inositol 2-dehydrogenase/D-chiro-inositol 1-dehydrogenase
MPDNHSVTPPVEDFRYLKFVDSFHYAGTAPRKFGIALFGVGRAGMIHLHNLMINPRVNLLYVVEASDERLKQVRDATGLTNTKFVNSNMSEQILKDPNVDAVLITTPTQTHHDLVVAALAKGKPVFCEKPIANQLVDIKKCYETAEKAKLPLFCAFNRRFDPSFVQVKKRVDKGELGKLHVLKSCSRDSPLPSIEYLATSNGIFHDCAVHDIDLICWMLNEYPVKVFASATAHMAPIREIDDHDTVAIQMVFASGAIATIDLSRFANYGYDQRLEVFGPGGMIQAGNQNALGVQCYKGLVEGVSEAPIWYSFASRYEEAYRKELDHFLDVLDGGKMMIDAKQTLSVCQVASAAEESARTGKPVEVDYKLC